MSYIEHRGDIFKISNDMDLTSFYKSILYNEEDKYLNNLKKCKMNNGSDFLKKINDTEINLTDDEILMQKIQGIWYAFDNQHKQEFLSEKLNSLGKLDFDILGDEAYDKAYKLSKLEKGEDYSDEDFQKDNLIGSIAYNMDENISLSQALLEYQNDENLEKNTVNSQEEVLEETNKEQSNEQEQINDIDDNNDIDNNIVDAEYVDDEKSGYDFNELTKYFKDTQAFVFPFEKNLIALDDPSLKVRDFQNLTRDLKKCSLSELRDFKKNLQKKNAILRQQLCEYEIKDIKKELEENIIFSEEFNARKKQDEYIEFSVINNDNIIDDNKASEENPSQEENIINEEQNQNIQSSDAMGEQVEQNANQSIQSDSNQTHIYDDTSAMDLLRQEAYDNDWLDENGNVKEDSNVQENIQNNVRRMKQ
ncbi:hypothetical protein [Campylobacter sp. US33a]|uniref:hypothetical protein n=1 Tax=Campylobacter sp. US33a TaxID=2498120 RepID=UPI0010673E97|nr:hypothetical protein [Campylobacter sp. US33a]TEX99569.1 hypothetical protein ELQ16_09710 [Campylobacter sp. US33a]